jgi:hypothetical protein
MHPDAGNEAGYAVCVAKDAPRQSGGAETPDWRLPFTMRNILTHANEAYADRLRRSEGDLRH